MSEKDSLEDYSLQYIKYEETSIEERKKILGILFKCFDTSLDPCLYDESYLYLLYYKESLIGIICCIDNFELLKYNSHKSYYIQNQKKGLFIYNLGIKPMFRGKGLSNILLKLLINKYKNIVDYYHVQIFESNNVSLSLFNKNGFEVKKELECENKEKFLLLSRNVL